VLFICRSLLFVTMGVRIVGTMLSLLVVVHAANLEGRSVEAEGDCLSQEQVDDMEAAAANVEFLQRAANLKHQKNLEVAAKGCDQCDPAQGDKLSDFSSLEAMQTGGWSLTNINDKIVQYGASYRGWGKSAIQGEMVATLQGAGTVTVHLKNQFDHDKDTNLVKVMKNGVDVAMLHKEQELTITFPFLHGDTLTIHETTAIVRLYSVVIECPALAPNPAMLELNATTDITSNA